MCGILGFITTNTSQHSDELALLLNRLFLFSEDRGREAAGIAIASVDDLLVHKDIVTASRLVRSRAYHNLIKKAVKPQNGPVIGIGHARLVTNGLQSNPANSQPVVSPPIVLAHNGIVLNDGQMWESMGQAPSTQLDSEAIAVSIKEQYSTCQDMYQAVAATYAQIEGNASIAFLHQQMDTLFLATNNGSLYYASVSGLLFFASERLILQKSIIDKKLVGWLGNAQIKQLPAGCFLQSTVKGDQLDSRVLPWQAEEKIVPQVLITRWRKLKDSSGRFDEARKAMRRCTRCILPETMPFIKFDEQGVCNYCHSYQPMQIAGKQAALAHIATHLPEHDTQSANVLAMLSGGRDSCYGLHYAVKELGLKPIAYTYDWGLVTDIARRNASRMCGELGVEHIIVSADIAWKRANVRKNVMAWLKRPELGMVPLFMAGDKQYLYYAKQIARANGLPVTLIAANPMEESMFKAGFCGIDTTNYTIFGIPLKEKLRLLSYYAAQYLLNPRYLNSSLLDTMFAFASSYLGNHNYMFLFNYIKWCEQEVNATLINQYGWEVDEEAQSTWRIGDGTAAFYNYIYYTMAGLTENDTMRSCQVREGMITRESALAAVQRENQPRWQSLQWYASVIGFNLTEAIITINNAPKLYM